MVQRGRELHSAARHEGVVGTAHLDGLSRWWRSSRRSVAFGRPAGQYFRTHRTGCWPDVLLPGPHEGGRRRRQPRCCLANPGRPRAPQWLAVHPGRLSRFTGRSYDRLVDGQHPAAESANRPQPRRRWCPGTDVDSSTWCAPSLMCERGDPGSLRRGGRRCVGESRTKVHAGARHFQRNDGRQTVKDG